MFLRSKTGFGGVASTLIMFIAIVGVSTGLVVSFQQFISETQDSFAFQNDVQVSKLKTAMSITLISYNDTSQNLTVYVKNIGETKLRPTNFDLFVDEAYYVDFDAVFASNFSQQMQVLEPQETLAMIVNVPLSSGSHDVRVVTELGVSEEESFNT